MIPGVEDIFSGKALVALWGAFRASVRSQTVVRVASTQRVTEPFPSPVSGYELYLRVRLGPGKPFLQHIDLSSVVRFVLANMKPLAVIVCGSPRPGLVDCHQPGVVTLT